METSAPAVRISHKEGYQFVVDFGDALGSIGVDEPAPIGTGAGPSPEQLLVASVANCLCASLVFSLGKYGAQPRGLAAEARFQLHRNAGGRLRMQSIAVTITIAGVSNPDAAKRALARFQDFCTVSESVSAGIPVEVSVQDSDGAVLHSSKPASGGEDAVRSDGEGVRRPEDVVHQFIERANRGDLDGLLDLYDSRAVIAVGDPVATGRAEIRGFLERLLSRKSSFDPVEVLPALRYDDLALTVTKVAGEKYSVELLRQQPDGSWRLLVDQLRLGKK